jgi:hypothetical protein
MKQEDKASDYTVIQQYPEHQKGMLIAGILNWTCGQ